MTDRRQSSFLAISLFVAFPFGFGSACSSSDGDGPSFASAGANGESSTASSEGGGEGQDSNGDTNGAMSEGSGSGQGSGGESSASSNDDDGSEKSSENEDSDGNGDDGDDESEPKWDTTIPDGEFPDADLGPGRSHIWISNTEEGSISKINTRTMIEEGRYRTAASWNDPSRTSINLLGDAVVAGRGGGITKIYGNPEDCPDKNGNGKVDTSTDNTMLAWGEDECIAWHTPTPDYAGQRAVAWTQGVYDPETDSYSDMNVWIASVDVSSEARLYDGETGEQLGIAKLHEGGLRPGAELKGGAYGGAVDADGNFWWIDKITYSHLAKADLDSFEVTGYAKDHYGYGITIGGLGYVWTCGPDIGRFDPRTETWRVVKGSEMGAPDLARNSLYGGCMVDAENRMWHGGSVKQADGTFGAGVFGMDAETMVVVSVIPLPLQPHGIAIDFDGFVWGIQSSGTTAMRGNPKDGTVKVFEGLVGAYTYSDMTGFALASTVPPPAE